MLLLLLLLLLLLPLLPLQLGLAMRLGWPKIFIFSFEIKSTDVGVQDLHFSDFVLWSFGSTKIFEQIMNRFWY